MLEILPLDMTLPKINKTIVNRDGHGFVLRSVCIFRIQDMGVGDPCNSKTIHIFLDITCIHT